MSKHGLKEEESVSAAWNDHVGVGVRGEKTNSQTDALLFSMCEHIEFMREINHKSLRLTQDMNVASDICIGKAQMAI